MVGQAGWRTPTELLPAAEVKVVGASCTGDRPPGWVQHPPVLRGRRRRHPLADRTVASRLEPWALARQPTFVDTKRAGERGATFPAVAPRPVLDKSSSGAAVDAAVVVEKLAPAAPHAVGTELAGAELADAAGRRGVVIGCTLAAIADAILTENTPASTRERRQTPAPELTDAARSHV